MQAVEVQPMTPLPVEVIPVDPDGLPALAQRCHGTVVMLGGERVLLNLEVPPELPALVVGVQTDRDALQYVGIDVQTAGRLHTGQLLVEGQIGGVADELLQPKNLTPRFHFDSMTFTFGFAAPVLHRWEAAGVLQSVVIDRLLLCPRCHGLPSFRQGCGHCGSGRVNRLPVEQTDTKRSLCSSPWLEPSAHSVQAPARPRFTYRCQECRGLEVELVPVNQCLHCNHRFAIQEGYELVLRGYRVDRLEPTAALLPSG
jgi:hypothetical protein